MTSQVGAVTDCYILRHEESEATEHMNNKSSLQEFWDDPCFATHIKHHKKSLL